MPARGPGRRYLRQTKKLRVQTLLTTDRISSKPVMRENWGRRLSCGQQMCQAALPCMQASAPGQVSSRSSGGDSRRLYCRRSRPCHAMPPARVRGTSGVNLKLFSRAAIHGQCCHSSRAAEVCSAWCRVLYRQTCRADRPSGRRMLPAALRTRRAARPRTLRPPQQLRRAERPQHRAHAVLQGVVRDCGRVLDGQLCARPLQHALGHDHLQRRQASACRLRPREAAVGTRTVARQLRPSTSHNRARCAIGRTLAQTAIAHRSSIRDPP